MDVSFERGDPRKPKGHALAYFRSRSEPDKVYATYIIVLPISVDFAKYVPPLPRQSPGKHEHKRSGRFFVAARARGDGRIR